MNIAIICSNKNAYSETFIHAGIERLKGVKAVFCGGWFPVFRVDHGKYFPPQDRCKRLWEEFRRRLKRISLTEARRRAFIAELRALEIDAALVHYLPAGVALMDTLYGASIPFVVHAHGFDAHHHKSLAEYGDQIPRLGELAASVIVVSEKMRNALLGLGIPENKIVLRPYGVDTKRFVKSEAGSNPPTFLAVGRFNEKKAPFLTLLAFNEARKSIPDARLIMVGDGPLWGPSRELADYFKISGLVDFPGPLAHDDVAQMMRGARAFVQHSIEPRFGEAAGDSEGSPVAILEAGASGLPVVSTKHAGICESVIHGKTGLLVEERDVSGMASSMIELALDSSMAETMGAAARLHIEKNYSMKDYISTLQRLLEDSASSLPIALLARNRFET